MCGEVQERCIELHHTRVSIRNYSHQGNIHQGHIVHYKLDYKANNKQQSYPVELPGVRKCTSLSSPPFMPLIIAATVFELPARPSYNRRFFMKFKDCFDSRQQRNRFYIMFPRMYNIHYWR